MLPKNESEQNFGGEPGGHGVKELGRHKSEVKRGKYREGSVPFSLQESVELLPLGLRSYVGKGCKHQFVAIRDGKHTWRGNEPMSHALKQN